MRAIKNKAIEIAIKQGIEKNKGGSRQKFTKTY